MGYISLFKTLAGLAALKVDALRIAGGSSGLSILVYDEDEDAYIPASPSLISVTTPGYSGDGRDGAVHYTTDDTLTQDVRATTFLVDTGVTIQTDGFQINASVSITNNGTIHDNGASASGATPGAARDPAASSAGISGGGGGGRTQAGSNASVVPAIISGPNVLTPESLGASGGAGGGSGHGAGGNNSPFFVFDPTIRSPFSGPSPTDLGLIIASNGSFCAITLGCGGGGANATTGGTGGAGGGIVRLASRLITNNGTISAKGGNGSAGTASGGSGGGGGGGGRIIIVGAIAVTGTLDVSGGTGGAGSGAGVAGSSGSAGSTHLFS